MKQSNKKMTVGGQAVLEGVMMRAPERVAVAVRRNDGAIIVKNQKYHSVAKRFKFLGWPILRGAVVLIESIVLGVRALSFSSEVAMHEETEEKKKESKWSGVLMGLTVFIAFAIGLLLFFYVPLLLTDLVGAKTGFTFNLIDGFFRLVIFLGYLFLIAQFKDIRRVFEYHGAEHKSVFTFENQEELTTSKAKPYSTHHPRCGTSFLFIVIMVSILVFMFLGKPDSISDRLIRLAFVPLIGGLSYELIRLSDKAQKTKIFRLFILPGLWLQKITTKEPDESQLEVALVALKTALGQDTSDCNSTILFEGKVPSI